MDQYTLCAQAFRGFDESYAFHILKDGLGLWDYLDSIKEALANYSTKNWTTWATLKWAQLCRLSLVSRLPIRVRTQNHILQQSSFTLLHASQIQEAIEFISQQLAERMDSFEGEGSGWVFHKVISFQVNIHKHVPLKASSYVKFRLKSRTQNL